MLVAFGNTSRGYTQRTRLESLPDSDEYEKFARHADCDEDGRFRFDRVADGRYYLLAKITWLVRWQRNGGGLMSAVDVKNGDSKTVILAFHPT